AKTLVYSITDGNSGAGVLQRLLEANLPDAEVHASRAGWLDLGVNCPDASHLTRFNTLGNLPEIRAFWRKKLATDAANSADTFVDLTHLNAKAGLIENLDLVPDGVRVVLVHLYHDVNATVWSLHNRCDYRNTGFTWLFGLDPNYRNVCVPSGQFAANGMAGLALWYVVEMRVRAVFYQHLVEDMPNVHFTSVALQHLVQQSGPAREMLRTVTGEPAAELAKPEPPAAPRGPKPGGQEIGKGTAAEKLAKAPPATDMFGEDVKKDVAGMVDRMRWDAQALGRAYFDSGQRLGAQVLSKSGSRSVH
ncbi:MAG: hypothetical protein AB8B85_09500, partial [Paracoccaceae bacterium]